MSGPDLSQPISPSNPLTAQCFCGAIKLQITSPPETSNVCHCTNCRRATGSCFAHNLTFPEDDVKITSPSTDKEIEAVMTTYGDAKAGRARFCSRCGTKLLLNVCDRIEFLRGKVIVPAGTIEGSEKDERLKPTAEGFCKRREKWMGKVEGVKEFEEW